MFLQAVVFLMFKSSKYKLLFVVLTKSPTVHLISRNIKILKSLNSKKNDFTNENKFKI